MAQRGQSIGSKRCPSDSPRKLGTGTIEDNRRTILFNGCPIVQRLSPAVGSMSEATPQACVVSRIAQAAGSEIFRHSTDRDRVSKPSHEQIATATAQRVFFLPLSRWRERGPGGEGGRVLASFPSGHQATSTLNISFEEQEPTDYHQVSFEPSRSGPVDELASRANVCGELAQVRATISRWRFTR